VRVAKRCPSSIRRIIRISSILCVQKKQSNNATTFSFFLNNEFHAWQITRGIRHATALVIILSEPATQLTMIFFMGIARGKTQRQRRNEYRAGFADQAGCLLWNWDSEHCEVAGPSSSMSKSAVSMLPATGGRGKVFLCWCAPPHVHELHANPVHSSFLSNKQLPYMISDNPSLCAYPPPSFPREKQAASSSSLNSKDAGP